MNKKKISLILENNKIVIKFNQINGLKVQKQLQV
jgi:hypothetical protein